MTNTSPAPPATGGQPAKGKRRPFGLFAIIVIQVLTMLGLGLLLALLGVAFLFANRIVAVEGIDPASFHWQLAPADVVQMVLAFVVNGVCAVGLWRRQRWAWFLTMLLLGFSMLSGLYSYFTNSPPATYAWSMLLNVFMVFYLNQREVQAIFLNKHEREQRP